MNILYYIIICDVFGGRREGLLAEQNMETHFLRKMDKLTITLQKDCQKNHKNLDGAHQNLSGSSACN